LFFFLLLSLLLFIVLYNEYPVSFLEVKSVALTTNPHLVPRLKKEQRCTSTPALGLPDLFLW
jgi:hypothetical protein